MAYIKLGSKPNARYLTVRVPEQVPMRDEDGNVLYYKDGDTIIERQVVLDEDDFPVLDDDGNEVFEDVEVPAPFGQVKTETRWRMCRIPLASQMTVADMRAFRKAAEDKDNSFSMLDFFTGFFAKTMPQSIIDSLTSEDLNALIDAWDSANESGGVSQGE